MSRAARGGTIIGVALVLFFLHYDFWYWDDRSLVLDFLPIGLAWHIGISLLSSLAWAICIWIAWPRELEEWADEPSGEGSER